MDDEAVRLDDIRDAIAAIREGGMVVVVDDADRENEGDLILAAERVTAEKINFLEQHGRGLLCVPLTKERLETLRIPMIDRAGQDRYRTAYTVPVDASDGIATGISARDRAHTIRRLVDPEAEPRSFVHGGHVQPLRATAGGVLRRAGHTEAAVDLAMLAGLQPAAVLCEIKRDDGDMMRLLELREYASRHGLLIVTIADLIEYRRQTERLIRKVATCRLPTEVGEFICIAYESTLDGSPYVALVKGEVSPDVPTLVRMHSECLTGDALMSRRCDCGAQLRQAMERIQAEGCGVIVHIRQEGRGIGLVNKLRAYELQDAGMDTVQANEHLGFAPDLRDYGLGAQVLLDLGVRRMRLMTNNQQKIVALEGYGLEVTERVPLLAEVTEDNQRYLQAKARKMGHLLALDEEEGHDADGQDL
ncbi:MAG: bifunctional 3,4-dihydroxy-2-butanone-4-phosphate synthase/GTP cyclohydrolase II [Armatimonadetes bacterium]|nr:bifunctional 3,4-dihydroxy-2-butanone-4-phosphate synthase/GTP cyclohydrolase II [Armatimonadota bacterium]